MIKRFQISFIMNICKHPHIKHLIFSKHLLQIRQWALVTTKMTSQETSNFYCRAADVLSTEYCIKNMNIFIPKHLRIHHIIHST